MTADGQIASYLESLGAQFEERRVRISAELSDFYSALASQLETASAERRLLNLEEASDFASFDFFNPDENALSRILADLLSPAGAHGQGKVFLDRFLDRLSHPNRTAQSATANVRYQDPAPVGPDGGVLDITIDFGSSGLHHLR